MMLLEYTVLGGKLPQLASQLSSSSSAPELSTEAKMSNNTGEHEEEIREMYLSIILRYLRGFENLSNDSIDFSKPYLKGHFADTYLMISLAYGILIVASILANVSMAYHIFKRDLHEEPTYGYFLNIALANILHVAVPLPLTLVVILIYNWIFGKLMCYLLAPLQDISTHVLMMTHLLIIIDRYRFLSVPRKSRIPSFVCSLATWFFAVCLVLPYPIYMNYFDLGTYLTNADSANTDRGPCMCMANLENDIHAYMKNLFFGTYIIPLVTIIYMYVKASRELQRQEGTSFETGAQELKSFSRRRSSDNNDIALTIEKEIENAAARINSSNPSLNYDIEEIEIDVSKETRTQKYLFSMVITFISCHGPLMILRLAKSAIMETYDNEKSLDIMYLVLIWIAFLSSFTTPCIYAVWQNQRSTTDELNGYLHALSQRPSEPRNNSHIQQQENLGSPRHFSLDEITTEPAGTSHERTSSYVSGCGSSSTLVLSLAEQPARTAPRIAFTAQQPGIAPHVI